MIRILHVDDDAADHDLVKINMMRQSGKFSLSWANSVQCAKELYRDQHFDCILSDYQMPRENGLDLLQFIRNQNDDIPFVFLTGQGNEQIAVEALRNGANDYFSKEHGIVHYERLSNSIINTIESRREKDKLHQVEKDLIESEKKYSAYVAESPLGFFLADERGIYKEVNKAACNMLGYSREELIGRSISSLGEEQLKEVAEDSFTNLKKKGRHFRKGGMVRKDGTIIDVEIHAVKLNEHEFMAFIKDISEQTLAEKHADEVNSLLKCIGQINALIAHENDINSLMQGACDVLVSSRSYEGCSIILKKPETGVFEIIAGSGESKLETVYDTNSFSNTLPPCVCSTIDNGEMKIIRNTSECSNCARLQDPRLADLATVCVPIFSGEEVIGVVYVSIRSGESGLIDQEIEKILQDCAADLALAHSKIIAEERGLKAQALLNAAIAQSSAGIVIADAPDVKIRLVNTAAISVRGSERELLTGISIGEHAEKWQLFHADGSRYKDEDLPLSRAVLSGESVLAEEMIMRDEQGNDRWITANAAPIHDQHGNITAGIVVFQDTTDRRNALEELRLNQTILNTAEEIAALGSWVVDLDTMAVFASEKAYRIYGHKESEPLTLDDIQKYPLKEYRPMLDQALSDLLAGRKEYNVEFRIKRKNDNHIAWVRSGAIFDGDQNKVFGYIQDISVQKSTERALRDSEALYRSLAQNFPDGALFVLDKNYKYLTANGLILPVIGVDPEEIIGKTPEEIIPDQWKSVKQALDSALKGTDSYYEITFADRIFYNKAIPIKQPDGHIEHLVIVAQDITQSLRAEEKLIKSEESYRLLVENQTDLIVKVDPEGRFEFVSPSYCKTFGMNQKELLGNAFLPLVHEEDREATSKAMENLYEPPYKAYIEQRAKTANGWRWFAWSDTAIVNDAGEVTSIIGVGRDITPRKAAEKELQETNRLLSQRTRELEATNSELEAFTHSVTHDLKAPIRHIHGFLDLIRDHDLDEENKIIIGKVNQRLRELKTIIDSLLRLSRIQSGNLTLATVDLGAMALVIFNRIVSEREIAFNVQKGIEVCGDEELLNAMLNNLVSNAIKFTSEVQKPEINLYVERQDDEEITLVLADNGVGFDSRNKNKIFLPFYRDHPSDKYEGSGIGLSTVKRIVEKHGGSIWAESEAGQGATFRFTLPATKSRSEC